MIASQSIHSGGCHCQAFFVGIYSPCHHPQALCPQGIGKRFVRPEIGFETYSAEIVFTAESGNFFSSREFSKMLFQVDQQHPWKIWEKLIGKLQRFDFKGTKSTVEIENGNAIKIVTEDDTRMRNIVDILQGKFIKRGVAIKNLEYGKVEPAAGGMVRQSIKVKQGIDADVAKKITKDIKNLKVKVQAQLQDDQIRVSGKKIDDLQAVIAFLKGQDYGVELQFSNFRS